MPPEKNPIEEYLARVTDFLEAMTTPESDDPEDDVTTEATVGENTVSVPSWTRGQAIEYALRIGPAIYNAEDLIQSADLIARYLETGEVPPEETD